MRFSKFSKAKLIRLANIMEEAGLDMQKLYFASMGIVRFYRDYRAFKNQAKASNGQFFIDTVYPCLSERSKSSGIAKGHYFHQDLMVARQIYHKAPKRHTDIGSRLDGFVSHLAVFRSVNVIDIRTQDQKIPNIAFFQADVMGRIPHELFNSCDSLSCLHALEHFGLGRYGDPIRYDGFLVGLKNMSTILQTGGIFYLSVPIGPQRVEFNAHRVFSLNFLVPLLSRTFRIERFSYVDDLGNLHEDEKLTEASIESNFHCRYGCGIFEMIKVRSWNDSV